MSNYSFDYGNSHWTFLDSNVYVDWSIRTSATGWPATWPRLATRRGSSWCSTIRAFNSSRAHFNEQQMRLVSDILEHRGVDIVFNGHVPQLPAHASR